MHIVSTFALNDQVYSYLNETNVKCHERISNVPKNNYSATNCTYRYHLMASQIIRIIIDRPRSNNGQKERERKGKRAVSRLIEIFKDAKRVEKTATGRTGRKRKKERKKRLLEYRQDLTNLFRSA